MAAQPRIVGPVQLRNGVVVAAASSGKTHQLSDEQQALLDAVAAGHDVIVDATVGSGKTTAIEALCNAFGSQMNILYLTYSRLLKLDAQQRVSGAKVQNYHGIVYPWLLKAGIRCGIGESIRQFNEHFKQISAGFPVYDLLMIDEYQDLNEDYADLLTNIKSKNPLMQTVFVGDMSQKVRSDTALDVQTFVKEFCQNPKELPFTQSFRIGQALASKLGAAWNKPIVGVNNQQKVAMVSFDDAVELMGQREPGEILALGARNGPLSKALNAIERQWPAKFNKHTVFASIRDSDSGGRAVQHHDDAAIFTTFDASKGLEREVSIIFGYTEDFWDVRTSMPNADLEVLRNVFLVAASRGKGEVYFVQADPGDEPEIGDIGYIPISRFTQLPDRLPLVYEQPLMVSEAFDFKYAENIRDAYDLLEVERLDDGNAPEIQIDRSEALIDLSPVVGNYQEAVYFDHYDASRELLLSGHEFSEMLLDDLSGDPWKDSLVVTAGATEQLRYIKQVTLGISNAARDALCARLAEQLPSDALIQYPLSLRGQAMQSRSEWTSIEFSGIGDAMHQDVLYELKYTSELTHAMFLQLGMYLVMGDIAEGILWNTRTDERWKVTVPDQQRFLDAVILCVTKQRYRAFR